MLVNKKSIQINLFRNPTKRIMFSKIDLNYHLYICNNTIHLVNVKHNLNKKPFY